jgi:hypothetical protein
VCCCCLCFYYNGGNYAFRNPILTVWQLMMFSPRVGSVGGFWHRNPDLIFGLWCISLQLFFTRSTRQYYFTILIFVTERAVSAYTYVAFWLVAYIPRRERGNTSFVTGKLPVLPTQIRSPKLCDLPVIDAAENLWITSKHMQQKLY